MRLCSRLASCSPWLVLSLCCSFWLVGCGGGDDTSDANTKPKEDAQAGLDTIPEPWERESDEPSESPKPGEPGERPAERPKARSAAMAEYRAKLVEPKGVEDVVEPIDVLTDGVIDEATAETIDKLLPLLKSANVNVRKRAAEKLGYVDDLPAEGFTALAETLLDRNSEVREEASSSLWYQDEPALAVLPALADALYDPDLSVRSNVANALEELGSDGAVAVPQLTALLEQSDDNDFAIRLLGNIGPKARSAAPVLMKRWEEWSYGDHVQVALGKIGAKDVLLQKARSSDSGDRRKALVGLSYVTPSTKEIVSLLIAGTKDEETRKSAVAGLGRAHPTTEQIVSVIGQALKSKDEDVREKAALALVDIEPKLDSAIPLLLSAMQDEHTDVRQYAARALGKFESNPKARVSALLIAFTDEDWSIRNDADSALRESVEDSFPVLVEVADDPKSDTTLRLAAANMLFRLQEHDKDVVRDVMGRLVGNTEVTPEIRVRAAYTLRYHASRLDAFLGGLKESKDAGYRELAAIGLGQMRDDRAVSALTNALNDEAPAVSRAAADALGRIRSEKAVPSLIAVLDDDEAQNRRQAAEALGTIGDRSALPALVAAGEKSKDVEVRRGVIDSLGRLLRVREDEEPPEVPAGLGERAVDLMRAGLTDDSTDARENAAEALAALGPSAAPAVPDLVKALKDENEYVRWEVAGALGSIGDKASTAVPPLLAALAAEDPDNEYARREFIEALGDIGADAENVVPVLIAQLEDSEVAWTAIDALGNFGAAAAAAVPKLLPHLEHADEYHRGVTADTLGEIGPKSAPALEDLLRLASEDEDEDVRSRAARALFLITPKDPRVVSAMIATLPEDPDEDDVGKTLESLGENATEVIKTALSHEQARVRANALALVAGLDDDAVSRPLLVKALEDPELPARASAAKILAGRPDTPEAVLPVLVEALAIDDDWRLNQRIEEAGRRSVPLLAEAFETADDEEHRKRVSYALRNLGNRARSAVPALERVLEGEDPAARQQAAVTLGYVQRGNAKLAPVLTAALGSDDDRLRSEAASLLSYDVPLDESTTTALLAVLEASPEPDERIANGVARALGRSPMNESQQARVTNLFDDDKRVPYAVVAAVATKNRPAEWTPKLVAALGHSKADVRQQAGYALAGTPEAQPLLARAIRDDALSSRARVAALTALRQSPTPGDEELDELVEAVTPLLESEDGFVRRAAAMLLLSWNREIDRVLPMTVEIVTSDEDLRYEIVDELRDVDSESLGRMRPKFEALLGHANRQIDGAAFELVAMTGPDDPALARTLLDRYLAVESDRDRRDYVYRFRVFGETLNEPLGDLLDSGDAVAREKLLPLCEYSSRTVKPLAPKIAELLESDDATTVAHAAVALARIDPSVPGVVPALLARLETADDDEEPRASEVVSAIGQCGEHAAEAVPRLIALFDDENLRDSAVYALNRLGSTAKPAVPGLIALLDDEDVSYEAMQALGSIGDPAAAPALVDLLDDPRSRTTAAEALADLGEPGKAGVAVLTELLDDEFDRYDAVIALAEFDVNAGDAVPKLAELLEEDDAELQRLVAGTLGTIGEPAAKAVPSLLPLLDSTDVEVRRSATTALGYIGADAEQVLPKLAELLESDDERVARAALYAIGGFEEEAGPAVPGLVAKLDDESLRTNAVHVLGRVGEAASEAEPKLIELLDETTGTGSRARSLRRALATSLGKIGGAKHVDRMVTVWREAEYRDGLAKAIWELDPEAARVAGIEEPAADED